MKARFVISARTTTLGAGSTHQNAQIAEPNTASRSLPRRGGLIRTTCESARKATSPSDRPTPATRPAKTSGRTLGLEAPPFPRRNPCKR